MIVVVIVMVPISVVAVSVLHRVVRVAGNPQGLPLQF